MSSVREWLVKCLWKDSWATFVFLKHDLSRMLCCWKLICLVFFFCLPAFCVYWLSLLCRPTSGRAQSIYLTKCEIICFNKQMRDSIAHVAVLQSRTTLREAGRVLHHQSLCCLSVIWCEIVAQLQAVWQNRYHSWTVWLYWSLYGDPSTGFKGGEKIQALSSSWYLMRVLFVLFSCDSLMSSRLSWVLSYRQKWIARLVCFTVHRRRVDSVACALSPGFLGLTVRLFFFSCSWRHLPVSHHQLHQQLHGSLQTLPHVRSVHGLPIRAVAVLSARYVTAWEDAKGHGYCKQDGEHDGRGHSGQ